MNASALGATFRRQRGATLIELVVSIVIVSVAVAAVLGALAHNAEHSADAMITRQAVAIAEAYLEEIALKPLEDPDGVDAELARADFDDVDDYDGLHDNGAVDQFGRAIATLAGYEISVSVAPSGALDAVPAADARRIDVAVSYPPLVALSLTAYKTRL